MAVPARGLPQGCCYRRHAALPGAWRWQALPARGLLQGSRSSSRQCVLHAMPPARAARRCTVTAWRGPGAPRVGSRSWCSTGGGWRVRGRPRLATDVQDARYNNIEPSRVRMRSLSGTPLAMELSRRRHPATVIESHSNPHLQPTHTRTPVCSPFPSWCVCAAPHRHDLPPGRCDAIRTATELELHVRFGVAPLSSWLYAQVHCYLARAISTAPLGGKEAPASTLCVSILRYSAPPAGRVDQQQPLTLYPDLNS